MTQTEALKLALEALNACIDYIADNTVQGEKDADLAEKAITAIKAALEAKDEPVPVAIVEVFGKDWRLDYMALPVGKHKLYAQQYTYTTPPQRKPLTDEEIASIYMNHTDRPMHAQWDFARAIEAAHGITKETK